MPRIIHFGWDGCWRTSVLRSAGYEVVDCDSLAALRYALADAADAIVMTDVSRCDLPDLRERTNLPLILFQSALPNGPATGFDWVIAPQTHPETWLRDLRALIESSHGVVGATENPFATAPAAAELAGQSRGAALEPGIETGRVGDWHSVALTIARKQSAAAGPGEPESPARGGKPARQT